ncbi:MAG TPA: radical SAM protein, partial [Kofleriaceae bacterium]|nr:radical SAM protein [Kofleriaceae bacterium]
MSASLDRRALLAAERGTLHKEAETRIALVYPSPYRAAMSSLGYQQIYRVLHAMPGVAADRAMLPDEGGRDRPFVTLEQARPVGGYPMLAYSVAYELEIAGVVDTLERASVPVLAADRDARHPLVVAGGPLTFSNPAPLAPLFDVVILGEGEELIAELVTIARDVGFARDRVWAALAGRPGYYLPHVHGERVPPVAQVDDALLPARSVIATPHTELADMFMTEAAREVAGLAGQLVR